MCERQSSISLAPPAFTAQLRGFSALRVDSGSSRAVEPVADTCEGRGARSTERCLVTAYTWACKAGETSRRTVASSMRRAPSPGQEGVGRKPEPDPCGVTATKREHGAWA